MRHSFLAATLVGLAAEFASSASTFDPARPPAVPLAVRSPYLSTWLNDGSDGGNGGYLAGAWPTFWTGQVTAWTGLIRVDGIPYTWMGAPANYPTVVNQVAFSYTSTRSTFLMEVANKVSMNITFLSPVTPTDLMRQSLPFSYLDVTVESMDGASHNVEIYSDVSGEWSSGDPTAVIDWSYGSVNGVAYHTFARADQEQMTEINQQASWGNWYWSTADTTGLTYQSGGDVDVRGAFIEKGVLPNTQDTAYRAIDNNWPVFAFSKELGAVTGSVSTVFSIGYTQDEAVLFLGSGDDIEPVPSLWTSFFSSDLDAMSFFYNDYSTASELASTIDELIATDSVNAGGEDYLTITSLSLRQAFGGLAFAGTEAAPLVFLKEISSDGDTNTVDVIFPAHPVLLYTNPALLAYLLNPLYINQESGHYPNTYSMHDLGFFPIAGGYPAGNDEQMPLEECGNMIIMTLAYAQRAGDINYLNDHYPLLKQWAGYLVQESLIPANQLSTDDFAGTLANQTNLALKGIIGLRAMSEIATLTNNHADAQSFLNTANSYISQWQAFAINSAASPPHTTLAYGESTTWGLLYNLYANSLLGFTGFVPQSVYDMQSTFYPTVALEYGIPLDTRHTYTKSDWELWTAAIASPNTRNQFIERVANWINNTPTNRALTDLYYADTGDYANGAAFTARPVVGGHFALLALS
ncbi:glutaminase GtaA [Xylariales sp. PMI_506]|nr:glutaminase GtaA [Xylariales sp. PMI_506]